MVGVAGRSAGRPWFLNTSSSSRPKVIFNAPQQDSKVLRVVFRVGYQVANPLTRLNPTAGSRYPAGVLTPAAVTP